MQIIQRSGRRSIRIQGDTVSVDGKDVPSVEADKVKEEGFAKIKQAMQAAKPSPQKGDSVVVVNTAGVHVSGTGVTIRRK